jgi:methyl-accepting chemotaxis protein
MIDVIHRLQHSLQVKLILPILLSAIVVAGLSTAYMLRVKTRNTELAGLTAASALAGQVVSLRTFYTHEVVTRAKQKGLRINHDFATREDTLPLPATLVKILGEDVEKNQPGTKVRLYSRYPFPHRAATETYDTFELEAITALEKDPNTPFYRMEEVNGRLSVRYATADRMGAACVGCHNTHPESPKTDWKVGDVRGVMEVTVPVDQTAAGLQVSTMTLAGFISSTLLLLAGIIVMLLRRTVIQPVQALKAAHERIRQGNYTARVEVFAEDELGAVATSFNRMLDDTLSLVQSQDERDAMQTAVLKLLDEVSDVAQGDLTVEAKVSEDITGAIADSFNYMIHELRRIVSHVQDVTQQVGASANEMQVTTEHLAAGSAMQANRIADSSVALNEMAVSIQHVSENAILSARVAEEALVNAKQGSLAVQNTIQAMQHMREQIQDTATRMKSLGVHSEAIGEIVQLIGDIADRTSVLALNASIEAALAGAAGQGFAVVAHEVERLAERAFSATRQVTGLINTIQEETNEAVRAMEHSSREVLQGSQVADQAGQALHEIESVSTRLAELIQSISLAASQQACGSESLSKAMVEISEVTQQTATGTQQAAVSISSLAALVADLHASVSTFTLPLTTPGARREG